MHADKPENETVILPTDSAITCDANTVLLITLVAA